MKYLRKKFPVWFGILLLSFLFINPVVLIVGCSNGDSCEEAKDKCRERGYTPTDCDKSSSCQGCVSREECECECIKTSSSGKTEKIMTEGEF